MQEFHIGNMIREKLKEQGRTVTWFAAAINSDHSNTYKMLKKPSIDLKLLMKISELLGYDFLKVCSNKLTMKNGQWIIGFAELKVIMNNLPPRCYPELVSGSEKNAANQ